MKSQIKLLDAADRLIEKHELTEELDKIKKEWQIKFENILEGEQEFPTEERRFCRRTHVKQPDNSVIALFVRFTNRTGPKTSSHPQRISGDT